MSRQASWRRVLELNFENQAAPTMPTSPLWVAVPACHVLTRSIATRRTSLCSQSRTPIIQCPTPPLGRVPRGSRPGVLVRGRLFRLPLPPPHTDLLQTCTDRENVSPRPSLRHRPRPHSGCLGSWEAASQGLSSKAGSPGPHRPAGDEFYKSEV